MASIQERLRDQSVNTAVGAIREAANLIDTLVEALKPFAMLTACLEGVGKAVRLSGFIVDEDGDANG